MEQQQLQEVYQILETEPYLNQNRGQTRHARGPVHNLSVSYMSCIQMVVWAGVCFELGKALLIFILSSIFKIDLV